MGTRKSKITVHGVTVDIYKDRMGAFFAIFGQVDEVNAIRSKTGISTGDIVLQVVLTRQSFLDITTVLTCRNKRMLVVVEGRRPCCWSCGAVGHMSNACPEKKQEEPTTSIPAAAPVEKEKASWNEVKKVTSPPAPQ